MIELFPEESPLSAAVDPLMLSESDSSRALAEGGVLLDPAWTAVHVPVPDLNPVEAVLAGRPRFERLRATVNRVGENLPFDMPLWRPPARQGVLVRAVVDDGADVGEALEGVGRPPGTARVYADPPIELADARRPLGPPYGTVADAAELMGVDVLHASGIDGRGVPVVLVDNGLSIDGLRDLGRDHPFDADLSYTIGPAAYRAGQFPPQHHGSMSAFQIGIAAPGATLVDHAAIGRTIQSSEQPLMHAWLSDVLPAYQKLREYLISRPLEHRALVVSNSWAMVQAAWDYPAYADENFADNPAHPFNRLVSELVALGADMLFSAGNCGQPYPHPSCVFAPLELPICGANSLPEVITIGAVDVDGLRTGYSSSGPGRLHNDKPDLCGYSHYAGSGLQGPADWGTSTSCPGVAGVVAAVRGCRDPAQLPPAALKQALTESARRAQGTGHDYEFGWGVIDAAAVAALLEL